MGFSSRGNKGGTRTGRSNSAVTRRSSTKANNSSRKDRISPRQGNLKPLHNSSPEKFNSNSLNSSKKNSKNSSRRQSAGSIHIEKLTSLSKSGSHSIDIFAIQKGRLRNLYKTSAEKGIYKQHDFDKYFKDVQSETDCLNAIEKLFLSYNKVLKNRSHPEKAQSISMFAKNAKSLTELLEKIFDFEAKLSKPKVKESGTFYSMLLFSVDQALHFTEQNNNNNAKPFK